MILYFPLMIHLINLCNNKYEISKIKVSFE